MHKWYDGKTPNCEGCGWFERETFPDGSEHEVCRWFSSVFETETIDPCEFAMSPRAVEQYLLRTQQKKRKK